MFTKLAALCGTGLMFGLSMFMRLLAQKPTAQSNGTSQAGPPSILLGQGIRIYSPAWALPRNLLTDFNVSPVPELGEELSFCLTTPQSGDPFTEANIY